MEGVIRQASPAKWILFCDKKKNSEISVKEISEFVFVLSYFVVIC